MTLSKIDLKSLWKKRGKRNFFIAIGVAGCLAIGALGSTLAANINLNNGEVVEFGQGMVLATACDSQINISPTSEFVNGTPGEFKFTGINLADVDTTDQSDNSSGCAGKYFELKTYKENGDLNEPSFSFVVLGDGTFVSDDGEITTENPASETTTGVLAFESATVNAADVYRITFQSKKLDGCYGSNSGMDGLTQQTAAPSGYWLAQNCSGYSSGTYWIQSEDMPNPLQMYVDMTEEGGGYDFYFITDGTSVNSVLADHSGTALGLDLVMPRSKYHWRAMRNAVLDHRPSGDFYDYFGTAYGVYRNVNGSVDGDYTNVAMNSASAPDWRVKDGGRWWLSDNTHGEPNGDYVLGAFLGELTIYSGWDLENFEFNDMDANYQTGPYYLVSTNAKP